MNSLISFPYVLKVKDVRIEGDREGEGVGESGLMSMFTEDLVEEEEEGMAGGGEETEHEEVEGVCSRQACQFPTGWW